MDREIESYIPAAAASACALARPATIRTLRGEAHQIATAETKQSTIETTKAAR